jgi:hypothetical protein
MREGIKRGARVEKVRGRGGFRPNGHLLPLEQNRDRGIDWAAGRQGCSPAAQCTATAGRWGKTERRSRGSQPRVSYGPPWAHYLGGYQDRLLGGPLGLPGLRYTAPESVEHKDYGGEVLG